MNILGLTAIALSVTVFVWRRQGLSPLVAGLLVWCGVFVLAVLAPLDLRDVGSSASLIIAAGICGLAFGGVITPKSSEPALIRSKASVELTRLAICVALAMSMVVVGVLAFRAGISSATGQDFAALTPRDIRAAQTGSAQGGGLSALLAAANPLLAALGVYGAVKYSRWWSVAVVIGLFASLQTPARLTTLSLIVQCLVVFMYVRRTQLPDARRDRPKLGRSKAVVLMAVAAVAMVSLFVSLGERVGKNDYAVRFFPEYTWSDWSLNPVLYFIGGPSALSYALDADIDPAERGGSIYALARLWAALDPNYQAPDTLADFVPIPIPFNVFTGFGQIYFDLGIFGVLALTAILGWLASQAHQRALRGSLAAVWVSSVATAILLSLPQAYRLFYLDIVFQLLIGVAMFAWISSASNPKRARAKADAV